MRNFDESHSFNQVAQRRYNNPRFYDFIDQYQLCYPNQKDIPEISELIGNYLNPFADRDQYSRLLKHNSDIIKCIRKKHEIQGNAKPEAFIAVLPLNRAGYAALENGSLDPSRPPLDYIEAEGARPVALYVWGLFAPGDYIKSLPLLELFMTSGIYENCPKYARPKDSKSMRLLKRLGWFEAKIGPGSMRGTLLCHPSNKEIRTDPQRILHTKIVSKQEDILKVFSIRSATYIAEQECPYEEEFDGNDYCSSHLLGYVNHEPVACIRIRYFAKFVKLERLAVRKEYRGSGIAAVIIESAIEYAKKKGFTKFYGHSRIDLIEFWERFGFQQIEGRPPLAFSDQDYVEIFYESDPHPDPISLSDGPYVLIRPEGQWDYPGILDPQDRLSGIFHSKRKELSAPIAHSSF